MTNDLFKDGPDEFGKNGHLFPLRNVLMAAVLKDLEAYVTLTTKTTKIGRSEKKEFSDFATVFFSAAKIRGITQADLLHWGALIKKDFEERNLSLANDCSSDCERALRKMNAAILATQETVTVLRKEFAVLRAENLELRNQIGSMDGKIDSLLQMLTSFMAKSVDLVAHEHVVSSSTTSGTSTPAAKRRRISAESDSSSSFAESTEESTNALTDSSAESTEDSANSLAASAPTGGRVAAGLSMVAASAPTGGRVATASSVLAASAPTGGRVATSGFFAPRPSSQRHSTARAEGMSTSFNVGTVT
jgi:hypothetical protein